MKLHKLAHVKYQLMFAAQEVQQRSEYFLQSFNDKPFIVIRSVLLGFFCYFLCTILG